MALVIVDAENVRRSVWPNIDADDLVAAVERWAAAHDHESWVVFEEEESADDRIAREAAALERPYWLVTSDRELRERAGGRADRVVGGGSFAREIQRFL